MSNLPAKLSDLANQLADSASDVGSGPGGVYMIFNKGTWEYGAEKQEIEDDSEWAVHPEGFHHGWSCWGTEANGNARELLGEYFVPFTTPNKREDELEDLAGQWSKKVGVQMLCLNGVDQELKVFFTSNSRGGQNFYAALVKEVVGKIREGSDAICPVIALTSDSYVHKKFGKTFTPDFEIIDWLTLEDLNERITSDDGENDDNAQDETKEVEAEEPPKQEAKKASARSSRAKKTEKVEDPKPEESTSRRRRARRA